MKPNLALWGILFLTTLFAACTRPKIKSLPTKDSTIVAVPAQKIDSSGVKVEPELMVSELHFDYLTAKSKVSFKSKTQNIEDVTVNSRIRKDSIIWLAFSQFGFEGARGLITKDSVFFMDKLHKEYFKSDFAALSKSFNFNLNFALIQSILIGNMPIPKRSGERFKKEKDYFMLKQEQGKVVVENYVGEQNKRLKKLLVTEQPTKKTLSLDYDDFMELNNFVFPYSSLIQLDYQSEQDKQQYQTVFKIKHQKIELPKTPLSFPFSIPDNYKRKEY